MNAAATARADQIRAQLAEALVAPCSCGECPTDAEIRAALALSDEALLTLLEIGAGGGQA
jgi:hypothetical protein